MFSLAHEKLIAAIRENPKSDVLRLTLVDVYVELLDFHAARALLEVILAENPTNLRALAKLPSVLMSTGDDEEAITQVRTRLASADGTQQGQLWLLLARLYEQTNSVDAAREALERVPTEDPLVAANRQFVEARLLIQEKRYEESVTELLRYLDLCESLPADSNAATESDACFQLSKAYDRMGEYDKAWEASGRGHKPYEGWTPEIMLKDLEGIRAFMTRDTVRGLAHADEEFEWSPLFIVGMPRSGTTLLEQILSMHQDVSNGGEMSISMRMIVEAQRLTDSFLPFPQSNVDLRVQDTNVLGSMYMDAVRPFAGDTRIVSNKSLALQSQLGFLSLCVPHCRAIMLYRHPLDNAVSCHTNNLVTIGHQYTTDMRAFAKVWVARRKLQEHWLEQLDIPMMELHYESMVHDQDAETRRLLAFLDVEWNPKCLDFHESTNLARTISFDQVNRKMYSTSDGRWKNYEKYLGPVIDEVGEYL
jgi:hypothetical protein